MKKILFKCRCMKSETEIKVPFRPPGSDIAIWMATVQMAIGKAHSLISPNCRSTTMEYAKIPLDENANAIGEKPILHS